MKEQERNKIIYLFFLELLKSARQRAQLKNSENWIFCILNHISPLCTTSTETCNSPREKFFFAETTKF